MTEFPFPVQPLRQIASGTVKTTRSFTPVVPERTQANQRQRQQHGVRLQEAIAHLTHTWTQQQQQRKHQGKPTVPSMPMLIQTDDLLARQRDGLKSLGLEVISKPDAGWIIATPIDDTLSGLTLKLEQFMAKERGGGKVASVWAVQEGQARLKYILSSHLLAQWDAIEPNRGYTVDVGVACVGERSQLPQHPQRKAEESTERFAHRVAKWEAKRNCQHQQWATLQQERLTQLQTFIEHYNGKLLSRVTGSARQPDSFSVRLSLSGEGLKDLVVNFPYLFEVVDVPEPDSTNQTIIVKPSGICVVQGGFSHLFFPNWVDDLLETYHEQQGIRLFVLDLGQSQTLCSRYLSTWAATLDQIVASRDVLFIIKGFGSEALGSHSVHALMGGDRSTIKTLSQMTAIAPHQPCLFYRAWLAHDYGSSNIGATDKPNRWTYGTTGTTCIPAKQAHIYHIPSPPQSVLNGTSTVQITVTLAHTARPRRMGKGPREYLATWLSWQSSRPNEKPERFLQRIMAQESSSSPLSQRRQPYRWTLGTHTRIDVSTGKAKQRSRSNGTLQQDCTLAQLTDLQHGLCIAVIGHKGWDNSPDADATYALLVSLEAIEVTDAMVPTHQ